MRKTLVAVILVLAPLAGQSATLPLTVAELAIQARAVASAEIVSLRSADMATPEGNFPFLLYRARTLGVIDGDVPAEFWVRVPGRLVDGKAVTAVDSPPLAVGRKFVLFLRPAVGTAPADAVFEVVGLSEGVLPLIDAPAGGPLVVLPAVEAAPTGRRPLARMKEFGAVVRAVRANRGAKP